MAAPRIRHTSRFRCPVCGGHQHLPQGRGERCAGFTLDLVVYCTREEHAGQLDLEIGTSPPAFKHRRFGDCRCGIQHGPANDLRQQLHSDEPEAPAVSIAERHLLYSAALDLLDLRPEGHADLSRRGLPDDVIEAIGFKSIPAKGRASAQLIRMLLECFGPERLALVPGFTDKNGRLTFWTAARGDGYVVPYRDELGRIAGFQLKLLGGKYKHAPRARAADIYAIAGTPDAGGDLYLTEGATKAYAAHQLSGRAFVGLPGQSLTPSHIAAITSLQPGRAIVALDREANRYTELARARWLKALASQGLPAFDSVWEGSDVGGPKGIDDLFQEGERPRIRPFYLAPTELGIRREVRRTDARAPVAQAISVHEARKVVAATIAGFVASVGAR